MVQPFQPTQCAPSDTLYTKAAPAPTPPKPFSRAAQHSFVQRQKRFIRLLFALSQSVLRSRSSRGRRRVKVGRAGRAGRRSGGVMLRGWVFEQHRRSKQYRQHQACRCERMKCGGVLDASRLVEQMYRLRWTGIHSHLLECFRQFSFFPCRFLCAPRAESFLDHVRCLFSCTAKASVTMIAERHHERLPCARRTRKRFRCMSTL